MHPDLDLHGVLQAAYRNDLEAKADRYEVVEEGRTACLPNSTAR